MTKRHLVPLALVGLLAQSVRAELREDFSGHRPGATFTTGITLGEAGSGWTSGWRSNSSHVETLALVATEHPVNDGPFLQVSLSSQAGQPQKPSGAVARAYQPPRAPFTLRFWFRPENVDTGVRYFLFDNNNRAAGTAATAIWQIESRDGIWHLIDGECDGMPAATIDTGMPVTAQTSYSFTIEVDPDRLRWSATISDGVQIVSHQDIRFRTADVTPERWLHFGANELASPARGTPIGFSVDTISVQPAPKKP
jgi:hypothetical protein